MNTSFCNPYSAQSCGPWSAWCGPTPSFGGNFGGNFGGSCFNGPFNGTPPFASNCCPPSFPGVNGFCGFNGSMPFGCAGPACPDFTGNGCCMTMNNSTFVATPFGFVPAAFTPNTNSWNPAWTSGYGLPFAGMCGPTGSTGFSWAGNGFNNNNSNPWNGCAPTNSPWGNSWGNNASSTPWTNAGCFPTFSNNWSSPFSNSWNNCPPSFNGCFPSPFASQMNCSPFAQFFPSSNPSSWAPNYPTPFGFNPAFASCAPSFCPPNFGGPSFGGIAWNGANWSWPVSQFGGFGPVAPNFGQNVGQHFGSFAQSATPFCGTTTCVPTGGGFVTPYPGSNPGPAAFANIIRPFPNAPMPQGVPSPTTNAAGTNPCTQNYQPNGYADGTCCPPLGRNAA